MFPSTISLSSSPAFSTLLCRLPINFASSVSCSCPPRSVFPSSVPTRFDSPSRFRLLPCLRHHPEVLRPDRLVIPFCAKNPPLSRISTIPFISPSGIFPLPDSHRLRFPADSPSFPSSVRQFPILLPSSSPFFPHKPINTTFRSRKQSRTAQMDLHPAHLPPGFYPDESTVTPFFSFQIFIYIRHKASIFRQSISS